MRLFRLTDLAAWDDLVRSCPGRTFFHRPAWLGAVAATLGTRFEGAICAFGSESVALVPLLPRPAWAGLLKTSHSGGPGALGGYGGGVFPQPLGRERLEAAYRLVAQHHGSLMIYESPCRDHPRAQGPPVTTTLIRLASLPPPPPKDAHLDWLWAPGPQEFHADRFGALEPPENARPRAFYYHLFRQASEEDLALLWIEDRLGTAAAMLVGLEGDTAYSLGLNARNRDAGLAAALLAQLPRYLGESVRTLDLGAAWTAPALPAGWRAERAAIPIKRFSRFPWAIARPDRQEVIR